MVMAKLQYPYETGLICVLWQYLQQHKIKSTTISSYGDWSFAITIDMYYELSEYDQPRLLKMRLAVK